MLKTETILFVSFGYVGLLFVIAYYGDKRADAGRSIISNPYIYALSLAVYCTSWTFYGAVGVAATTGWGYLPIYLGPILVMLLGFDLIRRIAVNSRDQRITSIADYIAFRYGRSHSIAVLVTIAAVIGSVPYIALQLKGITTGFEVVTQASGSRQALPANLSLYIALALALFAILFGTRHADATEHQNGLILSVAAESLVKLIAATGR